MGVIVAEDGTRKGATGFDAGLGDGAAGAAGGGDCSRSASGGGGKVSGVGVAGVGRLKDSGVDLVAGCRGIRPVLGQYTKHAPCPE